MFKTNNVKTSGANTDDSGCNLFVFDKRYQNNFSSAQPINVFFQFNLGPPVPAGVVAYALISTNKL